MADIRKHALNDATDAESHIRCLARSQGRSSVIYLPPLSQAQSLEHEISASADAAERILAAMVQEFESQAGVLGWDPYKEHGGCRSVALDSVSGHARCLFGNLKGIDTKPFVRCELDREGGLRFFAGVGGLAPVIRLEATTVATLADLLELSALAVLLAVRSALSQEIEAYGRTFGFGPSPDPDHDQPRTNTTVGLTGRSAPDERF